MTGRAAAWRILRCDLPASVVVFLVAVPLSLGIAVAAGAPLVAGLIAAIVGGVVAGAIGGAPLQVSGPAAGLTLIIASLVQTYGWRVTCAITVAAGLIQLTLGACRIARAALAVSPAVVNGMLAGIGIVIILAQLHVVLGGRPQQSALANILELPEQLIYNHSHAVIIGMVTIAVLIAWGRLPGPPGRIPSALPAVVVATLIGWAAGWDLPRVDLPGSLLHAWQLPQLPQDRWIEITGAIVSVVLVASVESLLCSVAIDRIRPDGVRHSDLNRELVGQGAANVVSGMLGGLCVAGVIVRSTANVRAGARTRASTILHGLWILVLATTCASMIEQIPQAALAALLVAIGVRMLDVTHIRNLRNHREVPVYLVTLAGVVIIGLAEGVLVGMALATLLSLVRLTRLQIGTEQRGAAYHLGIAGSLTFLAVPRLLSTLRRIPAGAAVTVDLNVDFMDNAAFQAIHDWCLAHETGGGGVDIDEPNGAWYANTAAGKASPRHKRLPAPRWWAPWSAPARTPQRTGEPNATTSRTAPRALLLAGAREYQQHTAPLVQPILAEMAARQAPSQMFITCSDARVVPNLITASGPGDLFTVRNIGNLVPRHGSLAPDDSVAAAVTYATEVLNVGTITICGHSNCGAMAALLSGGYESSEFPSLARWLEHGGSTLDRYLSQSSVSHGPPLDQLCRLNVIQQIDNLLSYPAIRVRAEVGQLDLIGMYFDLEGAAISMLDSARGTFAPVWADRPEDSMGRIPGSAAPRLGPVTARRARCARRRRG